MGTRDAPKRQALRAPDSGALVPLGTCTANLARRSGGTERLRLTIPETARRAAGLSASSDFEVWLDPEQERSPTSRPTDE